MYGVFMSVGLPQKNSEDLFIREGSLSEKLLILFIITAKVSVCATLDSPSSSTKHDLVNLKLLLTSVDDIDELQHSAQN